MGVSTCDLGLPIHEYAPACKGASVCAGLKSTLTFAHGSISRNLE